MLYLSLSSKEEFKEQVFNFLLSKIISRQLKFLGHILRIESSPIMANEASRERKLLRVFSDSPKSRTYSKATPANIYALYEPLLLHGRRPSRRLHKSFYSQVQE